MREYIVLVALLSSIVLWIGSATVVIIDAYHIDRDTTSWLSRAQVSSNPTDMRYYLEKLVDGMKKYQITSGYDAIIFKTPENNMTLVMKAINRSIDRCKQIEKMNISSVEYQTALDDLRGQLRELNIHSQGAYFIQHALLQLIYAIIGWLVPIIIYMISCW